MLAQPKVLGDSEDLEKGKMAKAPQHVSLTELLEHRSKVVQIQARTIREVLVSNGLTPEEADKLSLDGLIKHPHRIIRKLGGILADDMIHLELGK